MIRRSTLVFACAVAVATFSAGRAAAGPEAVPAGAKVKITFSDSTAGEMMAKSFDFSLKVPPKESAAGYEKTYKDGAHIVRESYRNEDKRGTIVVLMGGHLTVEVATEQLPAADLKTWLASVDVSELSGLEGEGEPALISHTVLTPLLPDAPAGWAANAAQGNTTEVAGFKLAQSFREYTKAAPKK